MSQFRVEETLSESTTTRVYRAYQVALERRVLLKVLRPHLADDPVVRERFVREAHACAKLRSGNIVQVYDLTEFEKCPAIVMEFVHGRSLKELLTQDPQDRESLARKIAVEMLQALTVAHRHGITHRDIKPGNILVTEDGTFKLTDFGLAHLADSTVVTSEGMVVGTPAYMSPEQVRGDHIDARTDLFALGATLVEVLTGERIFEGGTYADCVRKILAFKPDMLDRFADRVPPEFLLSLKRLLQPQPGDRFGTAEEALSAFRIASTASSQPVKVMRKASGRIIVAAAFSGILIFSILALLLHLPPRAEKSPSKPETIRRSVDSSAIVPTNQAERTGVTKSEQRDHPVIDIHRAEVKKRPVGTALPLQSPKIAQVRFTCNPWAKVFVDGQLIGETPIAQALPLPTGKHTVTFTNPLFDPIVRSIEVESDSAMLITADFMDQAGFLNCVVQPWAEVYVDGQYKDTTPLSKPIVASAGRHRLRFHNSSSPDSICDVTIRARDTVRLSIKLR